MDQKVNLDKMIHSLMESTGEDFTKKFEEPRLHMEKKLKELQNEEDRNQLLTYQIGDEVTRFIAGAILKIETTTGMLKCPRLPELLGSFTYRLSEPYKPIVKPQDQRYPEIDQLRYETEMTGVQCYASNNCFNFGFSNGHTTTLKTPSNYEVKLVSIQP